MTVRKYAHFQKYVVHDPVREAVANSIVGGDPSAISKHTMNKYLIPKAELAALLETASQGNASKEDVHTKVWFTLANRILADWDGVSYSSRNGLTPGQDAVVCSAEFYRGIKHGDLITSVSMSEELSFRTLKALEILEAQEYWRLLRQVEEVFPGKKFPKYAEDIMSAVRKQPADYFDKVGEKFVTGKGMKRPLHDYVFAYVTTHPQEFCAPDK